MKENLKEIKPRLGLGELLFDMSRDEVVKALGMPSNKDNFTYTDEEDQTETWEYENLDLILNFDKHNNWKLTMMSVESDFYEFKGKPVINLKKDELLQFLKMLKIEDLDIEDLAEEGLEGHELIGSDSLAMEFWMENGVVRNIIWSKEN